MFFSHFVVRNHLNYIYLFMIFWPFLLDQVSSSCSPKLGSLCVALRLERPVGRFRRRRSPRTTTEDSGAKVPWGNMVKPTGNGWIWMAELWLY